jgi:FkbM family methyltransferase
MAKILDLKTFWKLIPKIAVVEVGSRGGAFTDLDHIGDAITYIGFEPDPDECRRLNGPAGEARALFSAQYVPVALGEEAGTGILFITSQPGCSSLLMPDAALVSLYRRSHWFSVTHAVEVDLETLDGVAVELGMPPIDFIKLDVEGSEAIILQGGEESLSGILLGARIEVNFIRHRVNQPSSLDIIAKLENYGLVPYRLLESHSWRLDSTRSEKYVVRGPVPYARGQLAHGDILFLPPLPRAIEIAIRSPERGVKLGALFVSYGLLDHARLLLSQEPVRRYMSEELNIEIDPAAYRRESRKLLGRSVCQYFAEFAASVATAVSIFRRSN